MEQNIQKQLAIVERANTWIRSSLEGEKQKNAYRNMVTYRRKLNKKKFSLEANPAAAMYGESQAGKSYLVSALLSEEGSTFKVSDGAGNLYDFKTQINPRGNEIESTSLVTRFSTKYRNEHNGYPIIAKMLSPTDLILVICEAYYHNLNVSKPLSFDELREKISSFESTYADRTECQKLITEDEVFDIEDYFNDNFTKLVYNNLKDANFFERLSAFVSKIAPAEWKDVFPLFWNFNPQLTKLFDDIIKQYQKLSFAKVIYLPVDAVLRDKGTILDVSRLDEIYEPFKGQETQYEATTTVLFQDKDGSEKKFEFSKPYLCALTAELVFILPDSIKGKKPFLIQTDLLDFPGTRRFESTSEDNITDNSLTVLLRRGKVDYLFNKYSNNERINTLLFCQNHKQSNQSVIPEKLNRWIGNMMGNTPAERENFKSPISPLFVISTWFNKDLEFNFNEDTPGKIQSLNQRWDQRFSKTLEKEIFKTDTFPWLIDWTTSAKNFQNIFLLRDFDKSSETNSQIYKGFNQSKIEQEEIRPETYPTFREDLKKSFVDYDFVRRHFSNPAQSWDEAAGMNKDGTKLIIDRLTIAANNINNARREKTIAELNDISQSILSELFKYYHNSDKDKDLQKAKSIAGDIQHKMDSAFRADGIKQFGQFMKELMLNESAVLELYRKQIDNIEHRDVINLDIYSNYRIQVPVVDTDTEETYFERLCIHYEKTTDEQIQQFRTELEAKGVDLGELISGNSELIKNNARQLAEALIDYWFAHVTLSDKHVIQDILVQKGSPALQELTDMYRKLFKKVDLIQKIAEKIRRYVDGQTKNDLPYEIAADMSAELLNKCISTVGFEYFDESEVNDLRHANDQNKLGLVLEQNENPAEKSVEELFQKIENWTEIIHSKPEQIKSLPNYRNYLAWYNRLKTGFVSVCDIPNYNQEANEKLGVIIKESKTIQYG